MIIPTFCIHLKQLTDRKTYCDSLFINQSMLDINWVNDYDPDESFDIIKKNITNSQLSVILKSKFIYETQILKNYDFVLVLEDDIIIPDYFNFNIFLKECLKEFVESEGDILFIGGTRDYVVKNTSPNKLVYYDKTYFTRGLHAYITTLKCVSKLLSNLNYTLPMDHLLNDIIKNNNIKCGWTAPYIEQWTDLHINQWKSSITRNE
jgi:GR25 family glycosyltransferase involved in LPS biosynthesis